MVKKPKVKNQRKAARRPPATARDAAVDEATSVANEELGESLGYCSHYTRGPSFLNDMLCEVTTAKHSPACEHCREEPSSRRSGRAKKKGGGGKAVMAAKPAQDARVLWVCLDCGRQFCGGEMARDGMPYGHARRHSKTDRHPWVVQFDAPTLAFCFSCNKEFALELPKLVAEENEKGGHHSDGNGKISPECGSSGSGFVIKGLPNLGNTCFLNSVLQNLLSIGLLRERIAGIDNPSAPLTMALKKLFAETCAETASDNSMPSPKNLFGLIASKVPTFRGHSQQDSHELLRFLLENMQIEEADARKLTSQSNEQEKVASDSVAGMVENIFGGQLSSTVSGMECDHVSTVFESFLDLSLPVPSIKSSTKPSALPKIVKPPLRDRSRSLRPREKFIGPRFAYVAEQSAEVNTENPSISGEAGSSISNNEIKAVQVEDNISWMDYLSPASEAATSETLTCEESIDYAHLGPGHDEPTRSVQVEKTTAEGSEVHFDASSRKQESSSDISRDDLGEHTPGVISRPYHDCNSSDINMFEAAFCSQNFDNAATLASTTEESIAHPSVADAGEEYEFDGFSDMFNEPEVTSVKKPEAGIDEDIDVMLWQCSSPDVSEEVDNRNAPVTIEICFALFTQTEILSGEHAWHCERCSEALANASAEVKENQNVGVDENTSKASDVERCQMEVPNIENGSEVVFPTSGRAENSDWRHNHENPVDRCLVEDSQQVSVNCKECTSCSTDSNGIDVSETDSEVGNSSLPDEGSLPDLRGKSESDEHEIEKISRTMKETGRKRLKVASKTSQSKGFREKQKEKKTLKENGNPKKPIIALRDAKKRFLIRKAPPVLTIHLKRFNHNARGDLKKLSGHIGFKETLDIAPYMDPRYERKDSCIYRLVGIVEHQGRLDYGHYVAFVRADKFISEKGGCNSEWYYASDSHVRKATLEEVLRSEAYLLFYERFQG